MQLGFDRQSPGLLCLLTFEPAAGLVIKPQTFRPTTQMGLPATRDRFQPLQGAKPSTVDSCADEGHLHIESIQKRIAFSSERSLPSPQLTPLAQQTAVAADQIHVDRLQLQNNTVKPLAPQGRFTSDQIQIEGAEADAAEGADQIELPLECLAVAPGSSASTATQFELKSVTVSCVSPQKGLRGVPLNQITVLAASMGTQRSQQLNGFKKV